MLSISIRRISIRKNNWTPTGYASHLPSGDKGFERAHHPVGSFYRDLATSLGCNLKYRLRQFDRLSSSLTSCFTMDRFEHCYICRSLSLLEIFVGNVSLFCHARSQCFFTCEKKSPLVEIFSFTPVKS